MVPSTHAVLVPYTHKWLAGSNAAPVIGTAQAAATTTLQRALTVIGVTCLGTAARPLRSTEAMAGRLRRTCTAGHLRRSMARHLHLSMAAMAAAMAPEPLAPGVRSGPETGHAYVANTTSLVAPCAGTATPPHLRIPTHDLTAIPGAPALGLALDPALDHAVIAPGRALAPDLADVTTGALPLQHVDVRAAMSTTTRTTMPLQHATATVSRVPAAHQLL